MMNSTFEVIFGLLGGLAVFLFGMNMMSDCLQKAAGDKMKTILSMLTKNPILGVLAGALTTAVLQSSSATTVMTIGFVSAGLMTLPQAISIILGANIGTTMTAQLIAFKLSDYIFVIIFAGFILSFFAKSEKVKNIGNTIFAFGLLFLGIETMGDVMKPLAGSTVFTNLIARVADIPVLGVLVGTLMTLVVQSSSATIAVLQNFASQPGPDGVSSMIGLAGAIPILLGDNIGTTITALLASIGQSKDAKRTAVAHCTFNITGCFLFIWFVKPFAAFIQWISPKGPEIEVISRQIANAHTTFNIVMTLIWIPLIWLMVEIVMRIIPDGKEGTVAITEPKFLDNNLLHQPVAAMNMVAKEVINCSTMVKEAIQTTLQAIEENDTRYFEEVQEKTTAVNRVSEKINAYLADMFAAGVLYEGQTTQIAGVMHMLSDIDRVGSLTNELADILKVDMGKKKKFSKDAVKDLQKALTLIEEMYAETINILKTGDLDEAKNMSKLKEKVLDSDINMRKAHMDRVAKGKCEAKLTTSYNNVLHIIDRMSNSCVNIIEGALGNVDLKYFMDVEIKRA